MYAVGYIRVSTEEQARGGISLDMQRAKIHAYAVMEAFQLVKIIADEGISGCSVKGRPGIQKVLSMVTEEKIKHVVVYKLDRLARNTSEALDIAGLCDKHGTALHSITEKLDTKSAVGRFFFTLLASLAEMERQLIGERIQSVMDCKKARGEVRNGNPPYGFMAVDGKLLPAPDEQRVIDRIVSLHAQRRTIHGIIEDLCAEGLFNRRGKPFGKTQIHALLRRDGA